MKPRVNTPAASVVCILLASCAAAGAAWGQSATFSGLGDLPGGAVFSRATGISADGLTVVGSSGSARGTEAFRWTDPLRGGAGMHALGDLSGGVFRSAAFSVSDDGRVIVGSSESQFGTEAFRWSDPARGGVGMVGLGDLPGGDFTSAAYAMSAGGALIVGVAAGATGDKAFRWTDPLLDDGGGITPLLDPALMIAVSSAAAISPDGQLVVGRSGTQEASFASIWVNVLNGSIPPVQLGDLPGGAAWSSATAASNLTVLGYVVVGLSSSQAGQEAIIWTDPLAGGHGLASLGDLAGGPVYSAALDVSSDGRLIVGFGSADDGLRACAWVGPERTPTAVSALLVSLGVPAGASGLGGWTLTEATAVTSDGLTLIGNGVNPAGRNEGWIARLPGYVDPSCRSDRTGDREVNADDLFLFIEQWFSAAGLGAAVPPGPAADVDGDGELTADDLFAYLNGWYAEFGPCD